MHLWWWSRWVITYRECVNVVKVCFHGMRHAVGQIDAWHNRNTGTKQDCLHRIVHAHSRQVTAASLGITFWQYFDESILSCNLDCFEQFSLKNSYTQSHRYMDYIYCRSSQQQLPTMWRLPHIAWQTSQNVLGVVIWALYPHIPPSPSGLQLATDSLSSAKFSACISTST